MRRIRPRQLADKIKIYVRIVDDFPEGDPDPDTIYVGLTWGDDDPVPKSAQGRGG